MRLNSLDLLLMLPSLLRRQETSIAYIKEWRPAKLCSRILSNPMIHIPPKFAAHVAIVFDGGREWLAQLPQQIAALEQRWSIRVGDPFNLSYNYVVDAVRADGTPVALKLGVPRPELLREIEAVGIYNGRGMARLLASDRENGALLLERLQPGAMLSTLKDDEAMTQIGAEVMRDLFQPAPSTHSLSHVATWANGLQRLRREFDGGTGIFPARFVEMAETFFTELFASATETVMIHGDLHHFNILSAGDTWLAIDPKGMVGEPAYETGAFLRNELDHVYSSPNPQQTMARRIAIFAEVLELDRQKIARYALAQAVLSAWWTYEDEGKLNSEWLNSAELFATCL
ncbi:MAG: aminoglycoside phosphotransferase family protein [Candidatus Promineifilaceae bacterium]